MLQPFSRLERTDAREIDAQVNLRATMIFHGMRINAICFQNARECDKFIVDNTGFHARLSFLVQTNGFPFELIRLTQRQSQLLRVIFCVDFAIVVTELV